MCNLGVCRHVGLGVAFSRGGEEDGRSPAEVKWVHFSWLVFSQERVLSLDRRLFFRKQIP